MGTKGKGGKEREGRGMGDENRHLAMRVKGMESVEYLICIPPPN